MGIEPTSEAWEASILPLNYARSDATESNIHHCTVLREVSAIVARTASLCLLGCRTFRSDKNNRRKAPNRCAVLPAASRQLAGGFGRQLKTPHSPREHLLVSPRRQRSVDSTTLPPCRPGSRRRPLASLKGQDRNGCRQCRDRNSLRAGTSFAVEELSFRFTCSAAALARHLVVFSR
jgi:hypothetical protein